MPPDGLDAAARFRQACSVCAAIVAADQVYRIDAELARW
jgi:hypothetical protein